MTQLLRTSAAAFCFIGAVISVIATQPLLSQNSEGCFITIDGREQPVSISSIPSAMSVASANAAMFTSVSEIAGLDNRSAAVILPSRRTSAALYLSDFDLQIPQGVTILGLEVIMTASASVPDVIRDARLSIATSPTNVVGDNRANQTGNVEPWSDNSSWSYGSTFDQWGTTLSQSLLTQANFGIILQIRNSSEEEVEAFIDQLAIRVHYQAALEICGHPCVSLQSLPEPDVINYEWEVDNTLVWSPSNEIDHVVNIFAEQSPLGTYEICLTKTYDDGQTDRCCRPLNYTSCETGSIGDRIWEDVNGNGVQDSGEPGLDDYPVFLHTASGELLETMRSVNGQYRFDNLVGGTYFVRVDPLDRITSPYVAGNADTNSDIQNVYFFGSTGAITVEPGQNLNNIDLGLTSMSSICGNIWRDRDGNGSIDADLASIDNITVNLFDNTGDLVASTSSDESGRYCFDNIGSGEFQLEFGLPAGFGVSSFGPNQVDLNTGRVPISLSFGENSDGNDLFAFIYSTIGNEIWQDLDGDGLRSNSEPGLSGIQVSLMDCSGLILETVVSSEDGSYLFSELAPGEYTVCADGFAFGFQPTIQTQGVGGSLVEGDGCTSCIFVVDDSNLTDVDAGFIIASASIGDLVWLDTNENGVQDIGELGVSGVRVSLENCQGQEIGFQQTDVNGSYLFSGIPEGEYVLCIENTDPTIRENSNLLGTNECTSCFTHTAGVDLLSMDFAMQSVQLSGDLCASVWEDLNGNNRLDPNLDIRLTIAVNVFNCNGLRVGTIGADDDCLEGLPAGEYFIEIDIPPGFEQVNFGNSISLNGVGTSPCVSLGNQDVSIEIGIREIDEEEEFSSIRFQAIEDINENGEVDGIESGISGVRVELVDCNGLVVDEAFTDPEGVALFSDILQSEYYIQTEVLPGASFFSGGDITGQNGPGTTDCLDLEEDQLEITAAYVNQFSALSNISGQVWLDLNENGIIDPIEMGMSQVAVRLYDADFSILEVRYTDANGFYEFFDISDGDYILQFVRPPLYDYTDFQVTTNPAFGSDVIDPILGMTEIIRLGPGQSVADIDAGLIPVVTDEAIITGFVWQDENANSLLDVSESGYPDMLILLFEGNGTYHSATFTDDNGVYRFPQLPAGEYQIQFELPDGFVYVDSKVAGPSIFDSEVTDFDIGRTLVFDIGSNEIVDGVNAGLKRASDNDAAIFGRLWIDANKNNVVDNDEPGYRDLLISLFDTNNNLVDQTMSSSDGEYDFSQLTSGDYFIQVDRTDGYEFVPYVSGQAAGGSQIRDLTLGRTLSYRLEEGQIIDNINIGFIPVEEQRIAIGGKVWIDANASNNIDQGEAGYVGMDVLLYDANDNFVDFAVTDNLGEYLFPSIAPGQYYIDFELPDGFDYVQPLIDGNSDRDSKVVNAGDGTTALVSLSLGDKLENIHAGIRITEELPVQISGRIWVDDIPNHLIDGNEVGMAESMILLFDQQMQYHSATFTDDEGYYSFPQLRSGGYFVFFSLPDEYEFANFRAGGNPDLDSEVQDFVSGRTDVISTSPGEHVRFVNAGIRATNEVPGSISGRMWVDSNENARDDAFEDGVSDFIVLLFDGIGNYHSATFTNDAGVYTFPNITPGEYFVEFDLPADFSYVQMNSPLTIADGSHVSDLVNGRTEVFRLDDGQNIENINAGIIDDNPVDPNANIEGRVWIDANGNDIEDTTEDGFSNLTVFLLNRQQIFIADTQTDADGNYSFRDLIPGEYILEFSSPSGYEYVAFNVGADDALDSDVADITTGRTDIITLQPGETKADIDLGLRLEETLTSAISGRVWVDRNYNDIEDVDEDGFQGVTIFLFDEELELLDTRVSPGNGQYVFDDLASGNYIIGFSLPGDHDFVHFISGSDPEINSDIIENNAGRTEIISLIGGVNVEDIDAGVRFREEFLSGIDGRVWVDRNYNDVEDLNEEGFRGVTVFLFNEELDVLETRVSDDEGLYSFSELYPDNYVIGFSLPGDHDFVHFVTGSDPRTNSDIIENNAGRTEVFTLNPMDQISDIDAGVRFREEFLSSISGRVWVDSNRDDEENVGESGFQGVTVFLFTEELDQLETRVSNNNGMYDFGNLYPDNYIIGFSLPPDHDFVHFALGSDPQTNSDIIENNAGRTNVITLGPMTAIVDIDAGVRLRDISNQNLAWISGTTWFDENENGQLDGGENRAVGIEVNLLDENGVVLDTRETNDSGVYFFDELAAANYVVEFGEVPDYIFTEPRTGVSTMLDSEVTDFVNGRTDIFALGPLDSLMFVNAGYIEENVTGTGRADITGRVWEDVNGNGILDVDEETESGIQVRLFNADDIELASTLTTRMGEYIFPAVNSGEYYVSFFLPPDTRSTFMDVGQDESVDSDIRDDSRTDVFNMTGSPISGLNAGYYFPISIGDAVWIDENQNGIFDIDEQGANNQIINLHAEDGTFIDRAFSRIGPSGQAGYYQFADQAPGNYYIRLTTQQGISYSDANQGSDDTLDSDITDSNGPGSTDIFFIPSGGGTEDIDVGLILQTATLGDRVWIDSNGNGIQDAGEEGLNGVKVELFNIFDVQVGETVTSTIGGEDGIYLFEDVFPTDYYVKFEIPDGFVSSPSDMGGVDGTDSDVNDSNGPGTTSIFLLSPAETDLDLDAGIFADAFIGDRVWHDRDLDGIQGANEPGIADVNVSLFRVEGSENILIDEVITTRLGEYRFSNIPNGDYFVVFEPGEDFELTTKNATSDPKLDSDADNRGITDVFTITNNQSNEDIDAGLVRPGNLISGLAWNDENQNGIFDSGEFFLEDITIWLLSDSGQLLEEQITGPGGRYLFDNIDNGTYTLQAILPSDFEFTSKDAGVNDDFDSDFDAGGFSDEFTFAGGDVFRNVDIGAVRDGRQPPVIFPNPSIGTEVQLKADVHAQDLPMSCIISDSQGRIVQHIDLGVSTSTGEHSWRISMGAFVSGVYSVRIRIGRKVDYIRLSIIE